MWQLLLSLSVEDFGEEVLQARILWGVEELLGGAVFEDDAAVCEDDAVGHFASKAHLVGDNQHGHAVIGDTFHQIQHIADHFWVQR